MTPPFPDSARFAWWATAWLRGHEGFDHVLEAVTDGDAAHVLAAADDPDTPASPLLDGLLQLRRSGATAVGLALPVEGDPVGLGGPLAFNDAALAAGEAAVAGPVGLVPARTGASVVWHSRPALPRQLPDVGEAHRNLRAEVLAAAEALADLDVARWRPEVADVLMNLHHPPDLTAPLGTPPRCVDLAARGLQAQAICDLALEDEGGAVSAGEVVRRRESLLPLAAAARRALVAACSPEVWPDG